MTDKAFRPVPGVDYGRQTYVAGAGEPGDFWVYEGDGEFWHFETEQEAIDAAISYHNDKIETARRDALRTGK